MVKIVRIWMWFIWLRVMLWWVLQFKRDEWISWMKSNEKLTMTDGNRRPHLGNSKCKINFFFTLVSFVSHTCKNETRIMLKIWQQMSWPWMHVKGAQIYGDHILNLFHIISRLPLLKPINHLNEIVWHYVKWADPSGRTVKGIGLRPLCCWTRVWIPLGAWMCLYVVLSCVGRGLCDGLITRPEEFYLVSNCMCDHRNPERGSYVPSWERQENEWMKCEVK
jgi:hypothetical protein